MSTEAEEVLEIVNKGGQHTVYLMVKDIDGQIGIDWGVDWGLAEGEELPHDVEELSDAQYTVWQCIRAIRGVGDEGYLEELKRHQADKPSGLYVPTGAGKPN